MRYLEPGVSESQNKESSSQGRNKNKCLHAQGHEFLELGTQEKIRDMGLKALARRIAHDSTEWQNSYEGQWPTLALFLTSYVYYVASTLLPSVSISQCIPFFSPSDVYPSFH